MFVLENDEIACNGCCLNLTYRNAVKLETPTRCHAMTRCLYFIFFFPLSLSFSLLMVFFPTSIVVPKYTELLSQFHYLPSSGHF